MSMSPEARAAASERMKAMLAKKRANKQTPQEPVDVADPALQEALAKAPVRSEANKEPVEVFNPDGELHPFDRPSVQKSSSLPNRIVVEVDWEKTPMSEAQKFYAHLKSEFENAGKILNARSNERTAGYDCFMCHQHFNGNPGMTDHSYTDPKTGLTPRVDICGELCVIKYHKMRIEMRTQTNLQQAAAQRGE